MKLVDGARGGLEAGVGVLSGDAPGDTVAKRWILNRRVKVDGRDAIGINLPVKLADVGNLVGMPSDLKLQAGCSPP